MKRMPIDEAISRILVRKQIQIPDLKPERFVLEIADRVQLERDDVPKEVKFRPKDRNRCFFVESSYKDNDNSTELLVGLEKPMVYR